MVMKETTPRDAFILTRGEYDRPTDKVGRAVPAFFHRFPQMLLWIDLDLLAGL